DGGAVRSRNPDRPGRGTRRHSRPRLLWGNNCEIRRGHVVERDVSHVEETSAEDGDHRPQEAKRGREGENVRYDSEIIGADHPASGRCDGERARGGVGGQDRRNDVRGGDGKTGHCGIEYQTRGPGKVGASENHAAANNAIRRRETDQPWRDVEDSVVRARPGTGSYGQWTGSGVGWHCGLDLRERRSGGSGGGAVEFHGYRIYEVPARDDDGCAARTGARLKVADVRGGPGDKKIARRGETAERVRHRDGAANGPARNRRVDLRSVLARHGERGVHPVEFQHRRAVAQVDPGDGHRRAGRTHNRIIPVDDRSAGDDEIVAARADAETVGDRDGPGGGRGRNSDLDLIGRWS